MILATSIWLTLKPVRSGATISSRNEGSTMKRPGKGRARGMVDRLIHVGGRPEYVHVPPRSLLYVTSCLRQVDRNLEDHGGLGEAHGLSVAPPKSAR